MKNNLILLFVGVFNLLFFPANANAQQTVPGNTMAYSKGMASVNDVGAAVYSVNITCAAGLGGLQPHLGLTYNSQSGSGPLGLGFSLEGLSVISRTSRTWEQDGGIAINARNSVNANASMENTVSFNSFDRFSLDGEQLRLAYDTIPINSSPFINYGLPNTRYYTEQNSFNKITLIDTIKGAPTYFTVCSKDGLIKEYGNTSDSRIVLKSNQQPIHWLLNKTSDRNGNYIKYNYFNNIETGEYYPSKIEYSGNSNLNKPTTDSIVFVYESTLVGTKKYFKGSALISDSKRIAKIICYSYGKIVRQYNLTYSNSGNGTSFSLLSNIEECSTNGICLSPIKIAWNNPLTQFEKKPEIIVRFFFKTDFNSTKYLSGDFDGDGLTDIMQYEIGSGYNVVLLNRITPQGESNYIEFDNLLPQDSVKNGYILLLDMNEDGKTDIFLKSYTSSTFKFYLTDYKQNVLSFQYQRISSNVYGTIRNLLSGTRELTFSDYNNDGLQDLIIYQKVTSTQVGSAYLHPDDFTVFLNKGFSNYKKNLSSTLNIGQLDFDIFQNPLPQNLPNRNTWSFYLTDVDNNSYPDLFLFNQVSKTSTIVYNSTNSFFKNKVQYDSLSQNIIVPTFTNPSDVTDMGPIAKMISTSELFFQDINSDGLQDILLSSGTSKFEFWINKGDFKYEYWNPNVDFVQAFTAGSFDKFQFKDYNNDGLLDVCLYKQTTGANKVYINKGSIKGFEPSSINVPAEFFTYFVLTGHFKSQSIDEIITYRYAESNLWSSGLYTAGLNTINSISEGQNTSYTFYYSNLTDTSVYKRKVYYTVYPNTEIQNSYPVVSSMLFTNASGGLPIQVFHYKYESAITNLLGRGFRGFQKKYEIKDNFTTIKTFFKDTSSNIYVGDPLTRVEVFQANGKLVSQSDYKLAYKFYPRNLLGMSYYAYTNENISKNYEVDGTLSNSTRTKQEVDDYGNVTTMVIDHGGGFIDSTVNTYTNDTSKWILGRLVKAKLFRIAPNKPPLIRASAFEYNPINGQLTKEIAFAELDSTLQVQKKYTYDAIGNIVQSDNTAFNGQEYETRTNKTIFDETGKFVIQTTNSIGQSEYFTYDIFLGKPLTSKDVNGLITKYTYDGLGRAIKTVYADGNWQTTDYKYYNTNISNAFPVTSYPLGCSYVIYHQSSVNPPYIEFYDPFDRNIGAEKIGFDGRSVTMEKYIDNDGKITKESLWHFSNETPQYISYTYDLFGRVISKSAPGNRIETMSYSPYKQIVTNAIGQTKTVITDQKGQNIEVIDNIGQSIRYDYDAAGNLISIVDPKNNRISNLYDLRGFKISTTDPDLGTYTYVYNGFGELTKQTDSKGNVISSSFDKLGRIIKRGQLEGNTQWIYDQGQMGIGKLSLVTNYDNSTKSYSYDTLGRVVTVREVINLKLFDINFKYDKYSRVQEIKSPSGHSVSEVYNNFGYVSEVRRVADNYLYWRASKVNALGQLEIQEQANNVLTEFFYNTQTHFIDSLRGSNSLTFFNRFQFKFDNIGNLLSRTDVKIQKTESFTYDALNRLTQSMIPGLDTTSVIYDGIGNILSKSDVGVYEYGPTNDGPHRVLKINLFHPKCIPSNLVNTSEY